MDIRPLNTPTADARLAGLDGLRAFAILAVILWHALADGAYGRSVGALRTLGSLGWAGVDLFFALSGFLITHLLLAEEAASVRRGGRAAFSLRHFYLRRAVRILPPLYAVFAANLVLAHTGLLRSVEGLASARPAALAPYALFLANYAECVLEPAFNPGSALRVLWSLAVEEHFYLLWPPLLALIPTTWTRLTIGAAVCATLPCVRAIAHVQGTEDWHALHLLSHHRIDSILWGALGALAFSHLAPRTAMRRALLGVTTAAVLGLVARGDLTTPMAVSWIGVSAGFTALAAASTALIIEVVAAPRSIVARLLDARPLRAVGRVSYGMYLVHFQVMDLARTLLAPLRALPRVHLVAMFACVALGSFGVATLLHVAVERPMARLKERLGWARPRAVVARA